VLATIIVAVQVVSHVLLVSEPIRVCLLVWRTRLCVGASTHSWFPLTTDVVTSFTARPFFWGLLTNV